jgi:hypothetical protein
VSLRKSRFHQKQSLYANNIAIFVLVFPEVLGRGAKVWQIIFLVKEGKDANQLINLK